MRLVPVLIALTTLATLVPLAAAEPLCAPMHYRCFGDIGNQHQDAGAAGVSVGAGQYPYSSWGDCAHGNCFHGTAVEIFAPTGTSFEYRNGADGIYTYSYTGLNVGGTQLFGYYRNDFHNGEPGQAPPNGFQCWNVANNVDGGAFSGCRDTLMP